jgi:hypothetical protein
MPVASARCWSMPVLLAGARRRALAGVLLGAVALLVTPAVAGATGSAPAATSTAAAKATKLTLSSSLDPSLTGATVSFTATVSPAVTGGTLTFTVNGTAVPGCSAVEMAGLSGVDCSVPFDTADAYTVAATYSGAGRFAASSAFLVQTVVDPVAGTPQPSTTGSPVTVVIAGMPSSSVAKPTIAYTESGGVSSTACTIDGQQAVCGAASATLSKLPVGPHTFEVTVTGGGSTSTAEVSWVILTQPTTAPPAKKKTAHRKRKTRHLK